MRVAGGEREVLWQNARHSGLRLLPRALNGPAVVLRRGQNVRAREEEHGGKAEKSEVNAEIAAAAPRDDTVHQRRRAREDDRQRDVAVGGVRALIDALGPGRGREPRGQLGIAGEKAAGALQLLAGTLRLRGQLLEIAGGLARTLFRQPALALRAQTRDLGAHLLQIGEQLVHVLLALEGTLALLPVVVLHDEIGDGAKDALAAEAAAAHRHALEHAAHGAESDVKMPVDEKIIEIQCLFSHAAGPEAAAGLSVRGGRLRRKDGVSKAYRCKAHNASSEVGQSGGRDALAALRNDGSSY